MQVFLEPGRGVGLGIGRFKNGLKVFLAGGLST